MEKQILFFLVFLLIGINLQGQSNQQFIVGIAGSQELSHFGSIEWTLGEPIVSSYESKDFIFTQGFHQSYLQLKGPINSQLLASLSIELYPNPVQDYLNIHIRENAFESIRLEIVDVNGKILNTKMVSGESYSTQVDVKSFIPGLYLLRLTENDGTLIQSLIISKIN